VADALPEHWLGHRWPVGSAPIGGAGSVFGTPGSPPAPAAGGDRDGTEAAAGLIIPHSAVAKTIAHLLGQLRATPPSRMLSRPAGSRFGGVPESPPWEIKGRAEESSSEPGRRLIQVVRGSNGEAHAAYQ
jgi:hypothetical protein